MKGPARARWAAGCAAAGSLALALAGCGSVGGGRAGQPHPDVVCVAGARRHHITHTYYAVMYCVDARGLEQLEEQGQPGGKPGAPTPPGAGREKGTI